MAQPASKRLVTEAALAAELEELDLGPITVDKIETSEGAPTELTFLRGDGVWAVPPAPLGGDFVVVYDTGEGAWPYADYNAAQAAGLESGQKVLFIGPGSVSPPAWASEHDAVCQWARGA